MILADKLDQEIENQNIVLLRYNFKYGVKAAYYNAASVSNPVIAINSRVDITYEMNGLKAHELGHHHTCCMNLLGISPRLQVKYETLAQRWALNRTMPPDRLIEAYNAGARSLQELTDYLEVSEEYILQGIALYEGICGPETRYDGYTITWDPFNIQVDIQIE